MKMPHYVANQYESMTCTISGNSAWRNNGISMKSKKLQILNALIEIQKIFSLDFGLIHFFLLRISSYVSILNSHLLRTSETQCFI